MHDHKPAPFLVVHHWSRYRGFYDVVLDWVALNLPEQRRLFQMAALPSSLPREGNCTLVIPWLQDPVQHWSERTYAQALRLIRECDRRKVPVVNRVERLARAGKFNGARLMGAAGLHVPQVARIKDAEEFRKDFFGFSFPFFVREDYGHGGQMIRVDTPVQARAVPFHCFRAPVAIQLIDLPDPHDGLYRKYRYVVAGELGVPHHVQVSAQWITRGDNRVINETTRKAELAYIETPCPHHELFQRARRALGLDFVAFDYSLRPDGAPLVWEANPYPYLHFSRRELAYRNEAVHRTMAILVAFYFQRASLPVPSKLARYLDGSPAILPKQNLRNGVDDPSGYWQVPMVKKRFILKRWADRVRDALRRLRRAS